MVLKNWAERLEQRIKRTPLVIAIFFIAAFLGSVTVLVQAGFSAWDWFGREVRWREVEYSKLTDLKAGFTVEKFREQLGSPVFERPSEKGSLIESSFQGRDYWVQTVSNSEGTVLLYAVTSCHSEFTPSFRVGDPGRVIRLNVSTLASVKADEAHYYVPVATANAYFFDQYYGGNPSNYKTFAWGLNDACPDWFRQSREFFDRGLLPFGDKFPTSLEFDGPIEAASPAVQRFRKAAVVNTYAETAPIARLDRLVTAFQIGVDRVLIRTVYEQSQCEEGTSSPTCD